MAGKNYYSFIGTLYFLLEERPLQVESFFKFRVSSLVPRDDTLFLCGALY